MQICCVIYLETFCTRCKQDYWTLYITAAATKYYPDDGLISLYLAQRRLGDFHINIVSRSTPVMWLQVL